MRWKSLVHVAVCLTLVSCQSRNYNKVSTTGGEPADFGKDQEKFFFGLATAPAHVEDKLHDGWLDFARQGRVAAFKNQSIPEERLRFWTDPDTEIELAAATGVKVFRMGVDWGRLMPGKPGSKECDGMVCPDGIQDKLAFDRYKQIVRKVKSKGMKVMMTLFHHSLPRWALPIGGWTNPQVGSSFVNFSQDVVEGLGADVDYWITFNEPGVFSALTYVAGIWPPGNIDPTGLLNVPETYEGAFHNSVRHMTDSHRKIYAFIKKFEATNKRAKSAPVGIAHNVSRHVARSHLDLPSVLITRELLNYLFTDSIIETLDFIGLNYYGAELVAGTGVGIEDGVEYSDSGRAVDPYGFYEILKIFHERYNVHFEDRSTKDRKRGNIPLIVTENGIADESDLLRPAYLVEHLVALRKAMNEGVPILGYVFWTISDNWEWADGYCPKFGLVSVDRSRGLKREPRPSYNLYTSIVQQGKVTTKQRNEAWSLVKNNVGKPRPFCRGADGKSSLDTPESRPVQGGDWRFTGKVPPFMETRFSSTLEALRLPTWLEGKGVEGKNTVAAFVEAVKALGEVRLSLEKAPKGEELVAVHLPRGMNARCQPGGHPVPVNVVMDNVFYFGETDFKNITTLQMKLHGVRLFVGPTGKDHKFASFLPRVNLVDVAIKGNDVTLKDPQVPLVEIKTKLVEWKMPDWKCELVGTDKFGEGFVKRN